MPGTLELGGRADMKYLRSLREEAGLSQEELARRSGVSQTTIARAERAGGPFLPKTHVAIAQVLKVSVEDLGGIFRKTGDGRVLARIRTRRGLSQGKMADILGCSVDALHVLE